MKNPRQLQKQKSGKSLDNVIDWPMVHSLSLYWKAQKGEDRNALVQECPQEARIVTAVLPYGDMCMSSPREMSSVDRMGGLS